MPSLFDSGASMEVLNKVKKYKIAVESTLSLNMLEPCEYYIMCILLY